MPSPERPRHEPSHEPEPVPYRRAARFPGERPAGQAYFAAQNAIYRTPACDVSVFRFQLDRVWHVAALGQPPPAALAVRLDTLLGAGEAVTLPPELVAILAQRRALAIRQAPWVERHQRPLPPNESP